MTTHTYTFDPNDRKGWHDAKPGSTIGSNPTSFSTLRIANAGPIQAAETYLEDVEVVVDANLSDTERRLAIGDKLNDSLPAYLADGGYYFIVTPSEPNGNDWGAPGGDWVHLAKLNKICWEVHHAYPDGSFQLYAKAVRK